MIPLAAIPAPMMSCSSIWFPLLSWGLAAMSLLIVGVDLGLPWFATPLLRRGLAIHAQFAWAVDKTHRIQACFCIALCMDKP